MNIGIQDVILTSPLLIIFLVSLIPLTLKVLRGNTEPPSSAIVLMSVVGLLAAATMLFVVTGDRVMAFNKALVFDGLTRWAGIIALLASAGSLLLMLENPATKGLQFAEVIFLSLNSIIGMIVMIAAQDLLVVFIGLEMMSIPLYVLIGCSHEQKLSKESAFKYFVLGSFASAIMLYGVSLIFGSTGSTHIPDLIGRTPELIGTSRIFLAGLVLLIIGFCFKVSIFPFHAWTPDVYQGAPTPHSAFMATAVKVVSFAAFLRVILTGPLIASENILDVLQWLAVITMLVGNTAAIIQDNLKRVLAYSSIAHSGYLLVGLIAAGITEDRAFASSSVLFYLGAYVLMTLGAFAIVCLFEKTENTILKVEDLAGYGNKHPLMALCLTVFLLSLAGVPPMLGFFGKFYMFSAAIGEGLIWLAIWGVINSVISAYYYLRPIVVMYMKEGNPEEAKHSLLATKAAILISAIGTVLIGVISGPIFDLVAKNF